jgi:hypothetical protein
VKTEKYALVILNRACPEHLLFIVAIQSSTFDDHVAAKALDGQSDTCSKTGEEVASWWKVDFHKAINITSLYVKGRSTEIFLTIIAGKFCQLVYVEHNITSFAISDEMGIRIFNKKSAAIFKYGAVL